MTKGTKNTLKRKREVNPAIRCFRCYEFGHRFSDCPNLAENEKANGCYKCGSTKHIAKKCSKVDGEAFQYATCFRCKKEGHIVRNCPINKECQACSGTDHLLQECPKEKAERIENGVVAEEIQENKIPETIETVPQPKKKKARTKKTVKKVKKCKSLS